MTPWAAFVMGCLSGVGMVWLTMAVTGAYCDDYDEMLKRRRQRAKRY
jgi:hypothetical protein